MDDGETTEIRRTRRFRRVALIVLITLAILVVVAGGVYVVAFVVLSPMLG
jgi:hypothetical protein